MQTQSNKKNWISPTVQMFKPIKLSPKRGRMLAL